MTDRARTHWEGCYRDPRHHECTMARIGELERRVERLARALGPFARFACDPVCEGPCHNCIARAALDPEEADHG